MPLLLSERADLVSPLPLFATTEGRMLGIAFTPGRWVRVRRGVYVERQPFEDLPPWKRYAVRVHAFLLKNPDAVLCLESAAVLHGLPLFGEARDIHVYDPARTSSWRHGDVSVHTSDDDRAVDVAGGIRVTALDDTVVDLARVLPPAQALAVADAASSIVQGGTVTIGELQSRSAGQRNARGRARLRWVWEHADGRAESPAESVSRAVILWSGFEVPELQQDFEHEGKRDRVDFFFPSGGVIGEADGWQKYGLRDPDAAARLLAEEKRREDRLRRNGHPFARWDLRDAWQVTPLCHALLSAGVPRVRAAQPAMLATLQRRPREKRPSA